MRYVINYDKLINQLVPFYMGGRKLILYLQALMKPLQDLNDAFVEYAKELRIEVCMTSQVGYFEWYLNRKFAKYFLNGGQISLSGVQTIGTPIYLERAQLGEDDDHMKLYLQADRVDNTVLYTRSHVFQASDCSFIVNTPAINTELISKEAYLAMLTYYIEKYRIGNKTYKIQYNNE